MMRKTNLTLVTAAALAAFALQALAPWNASAAGYKLADKTGASISDFRNDIITVKKSVDAAMSSLDKILVTAAEDPRKAFKEFDKAVPRVEDTAKKAKKRAEDIQARGQAYFKDWEKELGAVNNPEIRKLAEERKVKLQATFNSIKTLMHPVRDEFNTWLSDLKDLQRYLSSDLTITGIDAAKSQIQKTKAGGLAVQTSMDQAIAELNTIVATLTPAKSAPANKP
jgi:hypothetical protein